MQLVKEKENSEFKPVKLRLKIDLVSYPARAEGSVNMDRYLFCLALIKTVWFYGISTVVGYLMPNPVLHIY